MRSLIFLLLIPLQVLAQGSTTVVFDPTTREVLSQDVTLISTTGTLTTTLPFGDYVGQAIDAGTGLPRPMTRVELIVRQRRAFLRQILSLGAIRPIAVAQGLAGEVALIDRDIRLLRARMDAIQ